MPHPGELPRLCRGVPNLLTSAVSTGRRTVVDAGQVIREIASSGRPILLTAWLLPSRGRKRAEAPNAPLPTQRWERGVSLFTTASPAARRRDAPGSTPPSSTPPPRTPGTGTCGARERAAVLGRNRNTPTSRPVSGPAALGARTGRSGARTAGQGSGGRSSRATIRPESNGSSSGYRAHRIPIGQLPRHGRAAARTPRSLRRAGRFVVRGHYSGGSMARTRCSSSPTPRSASSSLTSPSSSSAWNRALLRARSSSSVTMARSTDAATRR
jgi:hypothetical protein